MLAILSDVHGNLPALRAVVDHAQTIGCTHFLSLGDVTGYGAQPSECIELLRELGAPNILGNHDYYVVRNEDCPRSRIASRILRYQRATLQLQHLRWLRSSHTYLKNGDLLFLHGGPENPTDQYLYEVAPRSVPEGIRGLFVGHTHVQIKVDFGGRGFCNPGSVGQPRDGDWRAAYATLDDNGIGLHRVAYDVDRAAAAMRAAGFEPLYYENLFNGTQIGGRVDQIKVHRE